MLTQEKRDLAKVGETLSAQYITKLGYVIISQNYHSPYGEIDIIAQNDSEIVIIEVKTRSKHVIKYAENSICKSKQKKITLSAMHFLSRNEQYADLACRFDVIILFYHDLDETFQIKHYKNAFTPIFPDA